MRDCSVKGCTVTEGLLTPVIVIPTDAPNIDLKYRCDHMALCPEHSSRVGSPYDFFVNKPQLVRRMWRRILPARKLDFDNMALMFEPMRDDPDGERKKQVSGQDLPQPGHG